MGGAMTGCRPELRIIPPDAPDQAGRAFGQPRATRWQFVDAELYCRDVQACHLQADLGRNRCAVPNDARPAGSEHARPLTGMACWVSQVKKDHPSSNWRSLFFGSPDLR